jgi:glutamate N-acetyltransferase / amino-acid N-acetyltransferase
LRAADTRAIIANSGNANACTGTTGIQNARKMAQAVARQLRLKERQVLVCSTGRIGRDLPIEKIEGAVPELVAGLSATGSEDAAKAIMTSDTFLKEIAVELPLGGKSIRIGGIAKGAGMINPNMATMLCFLTTDAPISKRDLQKITADSVEQSFNCITVDGDMSTNDTAICLANGQAGIDPIAQDNEEYGRFSDGLNFVTRQLARMIVEDGEGVTKFVEVHVKGAATYQDARKAAEAVANSALVKCSWYGEDPNWGRVIDAVGYSSAKVREEMIDIFFNGAAAAQHGMASSTPEETLKEVLRNKKFTVTIDLHLGSAEYKVFTTDLTPEYVKFNMGE